MDTNIAKVSTERLSFETILYDALKLPYVKINRDKFLRKELMVFCPEETVAEAIRSNPAKAGIPLKWINYISEQVIKYETKKVTASSFVASLPGGVFAVGAVASDITFYIASILRVVQKLAYLYGFQQFDLKEDEVSSETLNELMIFIGVMFGVQGATSTLQKLSETMALHISKTLPRKALTKTAIYPLIKSIASRIGIRMTKQVFADTIASAVPIIGGFASGALSYRMFNPCCMRLRKQLMTYKLCDPHFYESDQ